MKNAKLIIDGKEIDVRLSEEDLKKLVAVNKVTGYERVKDERFYYDDGCGIIQISSAIDTCALSSHIRYDTANYYSNINIANNNARADKLMRQLRRFAVEHREEDIDWNNTKLDKYYICYDYSDKYISVSHLSNRRDFGQIYFDSRKTAELAAKTFNDELMWYFTEYCDSL